MNYFKMAIFTIMLLVCFLVVMVAYYVIKSNDTSYLEVKHTPIDTLLVYSIDDYIDRIVPDIQNNSIAGQTYVYTNVLYYKNGTWSLFDPEKYESKYEYMYRDYGYTPNASVYNDTIEYDIGILNPLGIDLDQVPVNITTVVKKGDDVLYNESEQLVVRDIGSDLVNGTAYKQIRVKTKIYNSSDSQPILQETTYKIPRELTAKNGSIIEQGLNYNTNAMGRATFTLIKGM